jgi:hypothetical protein
MKKAFLQKVIYRQMVANIFSEEYIFFSDFLNHLFFLGIVFKKRRANLSDVAKERVKGFCLIHNQVISCWTFYQSKK